MIEKSVVSCPPCCVAVDVNAPPLTVERAARPKPARLVEEVGHLRRQAAKPCTRADDDGIVVDEILDLGDRGGLIKFVVRFARDLLRDEFGHAPDIDLRAGLTRPFGDRVRLRLDVAVGRIIENQNLWHVGLLCL